MSCCSDLIFHDVVLIPMILLCFFFNDTATTEIYTLSLHDALPICAIRGSPPAAGPAAPPTWRPGAPPSAPLPQQAGRPGSRDRKSTRLNSSHANISYAVFCLKKKKNIILNYTQNHKINNNSNQDNK